MPVRLGFRRRTKRGAGSVHIGSDASCLDKHIENQALFEVELASCRQEMEEVRNAVLVRRSMKAPRLEILLPPHGAKSRA